MSSKIDKYIEYQRNTSVPDDIIQKLKSDVISDIIDVDIVKNHKGITIILTGLLALLFIGILFVNPFGKNVVQKTNSIIELQVESVMMFEDHTAIWLEPLNKKEL